MVDLEGGVGKTLTTRSLKDIDLLSVKSLFSKDVTDFARDSMPPSNVSQFGIDPRRRLTSCKSSSKLLQKSS